MEGLTDNQLLLLGQFENSFASYIRKCLNECTNKRLQVSVGMALKRKEGNELPYSLTSNAAFSISNSFDIMVKAKDYIEVAGIDAIVPTGHLRIDLNFKEKDEKAHKKYESIEAKKNDETPSFFPQTPKYSLNQVILDETTKQDIEDALKIIRYKELIYDKWGFKDIDPVPRSVINLYGEPGTGKTMTAHAIAKSLNMPILLLNYSEIESKYVGEAPKNLQKAFSVAKETNSVLFFDEADSFISVNAVTCVAAVTRLLENSGSSTRSKVVDFPLPASPIKNKCGNFMPESLRCSLTKHPAAQARMEIAFAGSL